MNNELWAYTDNKYIILHLCHVIRSTGTSDTLYVPIIQAV